MMQPAAGNCVLSDDAFLGAFESCTLPKEAFHHRDHLRLAWLYLRQDEFPVAAARIEQSIRRFAAHLGISEKYHHTITIVWLRLVADAIRRSPGAVTLENLFEQHAELLDQNLAFQFYSRGRLLSDAARSHWIEPDLQPLP
jgi:predicted TPR repeat methyltransferase